MCPRLSLWNPRKGNDYKFIDRMVKGHFDHGGTALLIHRYMGSGDSDKLTDVQDALFMENRDRNYDPIVYELRGYYTFADQDFDLSQFGIFLGSDQQVFTCHINDMVEKIGRKIIPGDVIELPHNRDDLLLSEESGPVNQYWVVQEVTRASEGYDPGWWPHIWRMRCKQMQNTVEYADIFGTGEDDFDLKNLLSTYNRDKEIHDRVRAEAAENVPGPYYDWNTKNLLYAHEGDHPDDIVWDEVNSGHAFPNDPEENEYFLRTDYEPARLFQYRDNKWLFIEDDDTGAWNVGNLVQQSHINNYNTFIADDGNEEESKVNLTKVVRPRID